ATQRYEAGDEAGPPPFTATLPPASPARSSRRLRLAVKLAAVHQPAGNVGRLQACAFRRKMRGEIARNGYQNMPALVAVAPLTKLPHTRLEHLVRVKPGILAEQRTRQRRDQCFGRVAQYQMTGDQARRRTDLLLAVEGVEESCTDLLRRGRQVVEPVAA